MWNDMTDAEKATRAFNGYFEIWHDLYVAYMTLTYTPIFYFAHYLNIAQQRQRVDEHWLQLAGILNTHPFVVGHMEKLIYDSQGFALHTILFFKYEHNFIEQYWLDEIGGFGWSLNITNGQGAFLKFLPLIANNAKSEAVGLITKNEKPKRQQFISWIKDFMNFTPLVDGVQIHDECRVPATFIYTLPEPIRRLEPTPRVYEKKFIPLELLLSQKEIDLLWDSKKQRLPVDAVRQINEAKIIYKELLSTENALNNNPDVLNMLSKIETFMHHVRYSKQRAFDQLSEIGQFIPFNQQITVLGKQLLDLYQTHINGLTPQTTYRSRLTAQLSYAVQAFFKVWNPILIQHTKQAPIYAGRWTDWQCMDYFNQFVDQLRAYMHKPVFKRVVFHVVVTSNQLLTPPRKLVSSMLPSIHQQINLEDKSATKVFANTQTYISTLFKRNVVLICTDFYMTSTTDDALAHTDRSAIFTEFLRYAVNTQPLRYSLGYIGQWQNDSQGNTYPHVIFFMDASQIDSVAVVYQTLASYWQKFLASLSSQGKKQKQKLKGYSLEGTLQRSIVFNSLGEFNECYCRIDMADKAKQKLFISHVGLYLCKSRIYDHQQPNKLEKGLIKGTIKTAQKNVAPKTSLPRIRRTKPQQPISKPDQQVSIAQQEAKTDSILPEEKILDCEQILKENNEKHERLVAAGAIATRPIGREDLERFGKKIRRLN